MVTDKSILTISTFARPLLLMRTSEEGQGRDGLLGRENHDTDATRYTLHVGTLVIEGAENECLA